MRRPSVSNASMLRSKSTPISWQTLNILNPSLGFRGVKWLLLFGVGGPGVVFSCWRAPFWPRPFHFTKHFCCPFPTEEKRPSHFKHLPLLISFRPYLTTALLLRPAKCISGPERLPEKQRDIFYLYKSLSWHVQYSLTSTICVIAGSAAINRWWLWYSVKDFSFGTKIREVF